MKLPYVPYVDLGGESRVPVIFQILRANADQLVNFIDGPIEQHVVVGHVEMAVVVDPLRLDPHERGDKRGEENRFEFGAVKHPERPIRANTSPVRPRESEDPSLRCSGFSIALWIPASAGMNRGWNALLYSCADRIYRLFAAQHPRHVTRALCLQFIERFDRVERSMRRDDDIVA